MRILSLLLSFRNLLLLLLVVVVRGCDRGLFLVVGYAPVAFLVLGVFQVEVDFLAGQLDISLAEDLEFFVVDIEVPGRLPIEGVHLLVLEELSLIEVVVFFLRALPRRVLVV